ncbi:hypothetical protein ONZ51_g5657 [Trametes cubensis]|uniref:Uncharacterized protein n=1 Tax=Trametes cubensis TaxID=1111947 RepID=A0AAD7TTM8_9APHY|nr:hypothetical protein ONZ51_g5657 [Trametes cubensis]
MDNFICEASGSPPPPSYELSQHEFDQKTTRAVEESAAEPPRPSVDDDGFEIWDDAVFEAALTALAHLGPLTTAEASSEDKSDTRAISHPSFAPRFPSEKARAMSPIPPARPFQHANINEDHALDSTASGSSSSRIRPLRVSRRGQPEKERPSWYQDAGLESNANPPSSYAESSQASSSSQQSSVGPPRGPHAPRRQLTVFNQAGEAEREITPPPEFTPVGPSLDGPPYELVVMRYEGPELDSAGPSPELPPFDSSSEPQIPQPPPAPPHPEVPASNAHVSSAIPLTSSSTTSRSRADRTALDATAVHLTKSQPPFPANMKSGVVPRVSFDARMAYNRPLPAIPQDDPAPISFDASAFYSHAVAAQFTSNASTRRLPVQPTTRASVYSDTWTMPKPPSSNDFGAPARAAPPLVSPRPSYAYGRTEFAESDNGSSDTHHSRQRTWSPTSSSWR